MQLNGARILLECLKEQGVDTIFGYPGGTILNVYDELLTSLPTAVTELNNDKGVAAVKYVNVAGVESAKPFDGVNIKVTTYSDGSSKAVKVVK